LKDQSKIRAVSLSSDLQIAVVQRDDYSLDFVFLDQLQKNDATYLPETKHVCSGKVSPLLGVRWVAERHIVLIGDECIELHLVNQKKRTLKCLKSLPLPVNWFICYVSLLVARTRAK